MLAAVARKDYEDRRRRQTRGQARAGAEGLYTERRFRNCLPDHLGHVALGRRLYYEWTKEPGAIIELYCLSDGRGRTFYSAGQVSGVANARLLPDDLNLIRARLSTGGVLFNGVSIGQRAPLFGFLNITEDEDVGYAYASFLNAMQTLQDENAMEVD